MQNISGLALDKVIAFVTVRDAGRAKEFYVGTLGLQMTSEELPFALVFDVNGTMLRVAISAQHTPLPGTVLGWQVASIHERVRELAAAGVVFARFEGMPQDESGIWTTPSGAQVAWFKDPDGNLLSLTQFA